MKLRSRTVRVVCILSMVLAFGIAFPPSVAATDASVYRIGVGDVLAVDAFQNGEISGDFSVESGGTITFPLLGAVDVEGMTSTEVGVLLEEMLERDFYVDVQLQIEVKEYRSQPITVFGEVSRPGTYFLRGQTTLTQVLALAGGLKAGAGPTLELRRSADGDDEGREVVVFSTEKVLSGREGADVRIISGDVISVSAKQLCFITGEVSHPGQYEIERGLTLMQALSSAGGLTKFASQRIELHRDGDEGKVILEFDFGDIRKGKVPDPEIQRGDVIIIKRRFF